MNTEDRIKALENMEAVLITEMARCERKALAGTVTGTEAVGYAEAVRALNTVTAAKDRLIREQSHEG